MFKPTQGEKGYPWFFLYSSGASTASFWVMLLLIVAGVAGYIVYSRYNPDTSPDSVAGYTFAILGTLFMLMAAVGFTKRRKTNKDRKVGQLNAALNWHVAFALVAFALLLLHSFGNFNPRTGTYALYGMIAMVISGFIGRTLDRMMPRMIATEARKALTAQGEDRIESISKSLQNLVRHSTQQLRGFDAPVAAKNSFPGMNSFPGIPFIASRQPERRDGGVANKMATAETAGKPKAGALTSSWDLAYLSLDETPQELSRQPQYRFVPDKKSSFSQPTALMPGAQEHIDELHDAQRALQRELYFRYVIRYWRIFHITLAIVTVGLTLWHLEYAFALLIPLIHH